MPHFKKIAVCHGKSCSPQGASRIKTMLEQEYAKQGIEITETLCCGRCEHSCTIVVDEQPISDLSPENLKKNFIDDPNQAVKHAQEQDKKASAALDKLLSDDLAL